MKSKSEKFKYLAQKRMNKTINHIRLIGNLANKNNYQYSESDTKKIIGRLTDEINAVKIKFKDGVKSKSENFKL